MGRGVVAGAIWGLVVAALGLALASLSGPQPAGNDPPQPPDVAAPEPAATDGLLDEAPGIDPVADAPQTGAAPPQVAAPSDRPAAPDPATEPGSAPTGLAAGTGLALPQGAGASPDVTPLAEDARRAVAGPGAPAAPADETAPGPSIATADRPFEIELPYEAPVPAAAPATASAPVLPLATGDAAPPPSLLAVPDSPEAEVALELATDPTTAPALSPAAEALPAGPGATAAPGISTTPLAPVLPSPLARAPQEPEGENDLPVGATSPGAGPAPLAAQELDGPAEPLVVVPDDASGATEAAPAEPEAAAPTDLPGGVPGIAINRLGRAAFTAQTAPAALTAHAADWSGQGDALVSVVLVDDGAYPDASAALAAVKAIGHPVTVALDPVRPGAAGAIRTYRAAGIEVAALARLPPGAGPGDVEVALEAAFATLPASVALVDPGDGGVATSLPVAEQTMARLAADGRGFVGTGTGLDMPPRVAQGQGVPAVTIHARLDAAGKDAQAIRRTLDRAAFRARQTGPVVLLGRLAPDTISALSDWNGAGGVDAAPLSAVLRAEGREAG